MSRRHEIKNYEVFNGTLTVDVESQITNVKNVDKVAYQINWNPADSLICDIEIYASNDYDSSESPKWTLVNPNTGIRLDSTDVLGCHIINIQNFAFDYLKINFNWVSGSGDVVASIAGHSIGA